MLFIALGYALLSNVHVMACEPTNCNFKWEDIKFRDGILHCRM